MLQQKNRLRVATFSIGFIALAATLVWAEQVAVSRNPVDILKGKGSMYLPPLATVSKGEQMDITGHDGRWLRVQYQSIQGYVLEAALTGDGPTAGPAATYSNAGGSTDAESGTAAKGWDQITWQKSHGYSEAGLNSMKATRNALQADPSQWDRFKSDGHVGVR